MNLLRLFTNTEQPAKRFKNPVDVSLMRRIEEQRERLRLLGIEVTPLLRVRENRAAHKKGSSEMDITAGSVSG